MVSINPFPFVKRAWLRFKQRHHDRRQERRQQEVSPPASIGPPINTTRDNNPLASLLNLPGNQGFLNRSPSTAGHVALALATRNAAMNASSASLVTHHDTQATGHQEAGGATEVVASAEGLTSTSEAHPVTKTS